MIIKDVPIDPTVKNYWQRTQQKGGFAQLKKAKELTIGAGDNIFRATKDGIWLGAKKFSDAPYRVTPDGVLVASSTTITGVVNATSGYFGNTTNGITIGANGLTFAGTGYIRTAASGKRLEIIKNIGGYDDVIVLYDSSDAVVGRFAYNTGGTMWLRDNLDSTAQDRLTITITGLENGINIDTSGGIARSAKAGINIANSAQYGSGVQIANGSATLGAMINLVPYRSTSVFGDVLAMSKSGALTSLNYASRITNEGFIQFPAYYHCSEWDENIDSSTVLASSVIAKAYWDGGGTNGTQTLIYSSAVAPAHLQLSTTATANSTSYLQFGRPVGTWSEHACIEVRMCPKDTTNMTLRIGFYKDANEYIFFQYDTDVSANWYVVSNNGSGERATDAGFSFTVTERTLKIMLISATKARFFIDNVEQATGHVAAISTADHSPYIYIDNKAAAESKEININYIKFWAGRQTMP